MPAYAAVASLACRPTLAESLRGAFARHVGHTLLSFERPAAPAPLVPVRSARPRRSLKTAQLA
jgi:hypothetical protein